MISTQQKLNCSKLAQCFDEYELEALWRRENPDSSEYISCDRPSNRKPGIDSVDTDRKITINTKTIAKISRIVTTRVPSKTKSRRGFWYFNNFLLDNSNFLSFTKKNIPPQVTYGGMNKSCIKSCVINHAGSFF